MRCKFVLEIWDNDGFTRAIFNCDATVGGLFQNTVVYMCEHNEQGSMGLVINQPTDLSIAELYSK